MAETLTTQGLDISDKMPDKMPGISDKIPDNQSNLDVCHVSETLDNQESQSLCLTDSYFQEGGGVNDFVRQVENITQSEDTTIGVEPEPIKVGDKVFVLHPQANENGDTVHEIGDGWVTVDFLTKQFPIGEVVKM
jgi:hypothetical protein